jgi:hypothetical protein
MILIANETDALGVKLHESVSKIFWDDAVKCINPTTKRVWKLPTSTQLRVTWHTGSLDMAALLSTGASRYHNCYIDGGTSPEYFGYPLAHGVLATTIESGQTYEAFVL